MDLQKLEADDLGNDIDYLRRVEAEKKLLDREVQFERLGRLGLIESAPTLTGGEA